MKEETKCYCGHTTTCDCGPEQDFKDIELPQQERQETLEETAERISPIQQVINFITENFQKEGEPRQLTLDLLKKWCEVKLLNEESKWQQERSYSEEEVLPLLEMLQKCKEYFLLKTDKYSDERADAIIDVMEQFKKK